MHKQNLVTIAIPTYNRSGLLRTSIESCIKQTYKNLAILVIDGGSTDETKIVVRSFKDPRMVYIKNKTNIGMMESWNRSIKTAKGKYLIILGDDDALRTDFVSETTKIYQKYPRLGFVFTHANKVDINGNYLMKWGHNYPPSGYLTGLDYLFYTIKYGCCITNSSTMICNKKVYEKVGPYEGEFAKNTFDFNMYIKIAAKYDLYFLAEVLTDYKIHSSQVSKIHWRRKDRPTGKIGTYLDLFKAISLLLSDKRFKDNKKKKIVLKRIREIDKELTILLMKIVPEL